MQCCIIYKRTLWPWKLGVYFAIITLNPITDCLSSNLILNNVRLITEKKGMCMLYKTNLTSKLWHYMQ